MYMQSLGNDSLIKAKLDQGAMWSKLKLIQTNSIQILDIPPSSDTNVTVKIDTDLEKTYKYFEAGIYNDKVLQNLSQANEMKTKHQLLSLSERVLDFLVVDNEHLVILTNKNYLYMCSVAEYSKMRKLMIDFESDGGGGAYGVRMCQCTKRNVVGVLLSSGIVKFVNVSPENSTKRRNSIGNSAFQEDDPLLSLTNSRYRNISCGFYEGQLFVIANDKLTIYQVDNGFEKTVTMTDDVKSFQFVKGIDKDTKLVSCFSKDVVGWFSYNPLADISFTFHYSPLISINTFFLTFQAMLLKNGTVIIHFLK